jgi:hypothetical protein
MPTPPDPNKVVITAVVTSVIASIASSFLFDYMARPRLEARKERILGQLRKRREFYSSALSLGVAAKIAAVDVPFGIDHKTREKLVGERQAARQRMTTISKGLLEDVGAIAGTYHSLIIDDVISYIMTMHGVVLSRRSSERKAEVIEECTRDLLAFLEGRWWRPIRRVNARSRLRGLISELNGNEQPDR